MTLTTFDRESVEVAKPTADLPAIEVHNVSKRFKLYQNAITGPLKDFFFFWKRGKFHKDFLAVDDVSLTVHRGEVVGIVGPNGAGKSTLLKMIAGLLPVDSGAITVRGKLTALLVLGAGVHPEFTGRENIYFGGLLLGMSKQEIAAKMESIIKFAEIGDFIDQPFRTYSAGMRARLLFSISMSINPDILIVDEALATGDMAFVQKCERRIREMCRSGTTILFVSHNMTQIQKLCNRSILLMKGKFAISGTPLEVFNKYRELYLTHENERLAALQKNEAYALVNGDGSISIREVIFKDEKGQPSNIFFTGGPMTIEIKVDRRTPGAEFYAFIGFMMGNQYVGHIDTENMLIGNRIETRALYPHQSITIKIDSLVMLNGVFSLWIWFQDAQTCKTVAEYRDVGRFRVSKRHYPFDADAYFAQPVASLECK